MPQLANDFPYQRLTVRERKSPYSIRVSVGLFFSLSAEGNSWERFMPLEAEILANKKNFPHPYTCPAWGLSQHQRIQWLSQPLLLKSQFQERPAISISSPANGLLKCAGHSCPGLDQGQLVRSGASTLLASASQD